MARAPVSKTGGWGFESLHSCQAGRHKMVFGAVFAAKSGLSSLDGVAAGQ
jgi:hypothetical protein